MKPTLKHTIRLVLSHIGRSDPRVTWGTFPSGHDCGPWRARDDRVRSDPPG